ncbi:MAG: ORF6N domain-containing protein [Rhodocyclaceae bacterium]|nr:ORF6N domain-containing protein [Rhodocyclaceae bacterium]
MTTDSGLYPVAAAQIAGQIFMVRGAKVILDATLAALYGVETRALIQAVKRNQARFPADFMFQLNEEEHAALRSQSVISNSGRGGRRYAPYVFTEHGAIQASNVLSSARAIEMGLYVVRAFVQLRETLAANKDLARQLRTLEARMLKKFATQDETIKEIITTLKQFMTPVDPPTQPKRAIGFVIEDSTGSTKSAKGMRTRGRAQ